MKVKKRHPFLLIEVLVSMTLAVIALGLITQMIYSQTKKQLHDLQNILSYNEVKNFMVDFEVSQLPQLQEKEIQNIIQKNWIATSSPFQLRYQLTIDKRKIKELKDGTILYPLTLKVKKNSDNSSKSYSQTFLLRKVSSKKEPFDK